MQDKFTDDDLIRAKGSFSFFKDKPFRKNQLEALRFAANSDASVVVLRAPTGSGKSLIGATLCKLNPHSIYLVHSKTLQDQVYNEFREFTVLKGRSNYQCAIHDYLTAADCIYEHEKKECQYYPHSCAYAVQKNRALEAKLRILNYTYWLIEANYIGGFSDVPMLICDEADTLEKALLDFISLSISEYQIKRFRIQPPSRKTVTAINGLEIWKGWASDILVKVLKKQRELKLKMESAVPDEEKKLSMEVRDTKTLVTKLRMFVSAVDETWIYEENERRHGIKTYTQWEFKPTWISEDMMNMFLRDHVNKKIVLMSATIPPVNVLSQMIGIPESEIDFMEIESTFPPESRPIYLQPTADMRTSIIYKQSKEVWLVEYSKMENKIRQILARYPNDKGLIHAVNYKITKRLAEIDPQRCITHGLKDREEQVEKFKRSKKPLVMISPSLDRGIDLRDDLCRFIIIAKMPFPDLNSKQTKQRAYGSGYIGRYWYLSMAAQTVEQMAGRAMRNENDYCAVYLLDKALVDKVHEDKRLFSEYFIRCLTW